MSINCSPKETLVFTLDMLKEWIRHNKGKVMRKKGTWIQLRNLPSCKVPTLEGIVEGEGGVLCSSHTSEEGCVVDPFVIQGGIDTIRNSDLYEITDDRVFAPFNSLEFQEWAADNPDRLMIPKNIRGADGADPLVRDMILELPYILFYPTRRNVWEPEWLRTCNTDREVIFDFSWKPRANKDSVLVQVPSNEDDIYIVARERFEEDGWVEIVE